ncbi:phosphoserine phosphatase SerB [Corynebacterium aquatimens]|uniref:phosphoserine phosphatase n=1 Tax=Corynebacterium aquatimens TaxID=1190508 RepID=A0A931E0X5_9CORY|nr:phosphoserine phosphatase SerB [Corynebacterium aquatimens]MBG6122243.1 phosphoserine phosphatase [Corynebacterium aquatimens]WJY65216.1 Phosphoserine phosphatase [Corynebacterium aquatimens]
MSYAVALQPGLEHAVITLTGPDHPGVSASFFAILSQHNVQLLDVEQAHFRGRLALAAFAGIAAESVEALRRDLEASAEESQHNVSIEMGSDLPVAPQRQRSTHAVVVLGDPVTAEAVSEIGRTLASFGANIDRIRGISDYPVTGLEFSVTIPGVGDEVSHTVRSALAALSARIGVDIAIERAGLARRSKRLVCFDCDSTLITGEVIEMLAAHAGKEAEVAAVTERAMAGELDFEESLRERVATLEGLDESVLDAVAADIVLTPGARTTIRTLKQLGYSTAVVSGGFIQILEPMAQDLELDYVRANTLEIVDGKLTGRVIGKVVDRQAKAEFLAEFAEDSGLKLSQTVAVGDGANDIDMLTAAGLGIAFNAKPALKEVADTSVNHPFLDSVLYIMGVPRHEIDALNEEEGVSGKVALS